MRQAISRYKERKARRIEENYAHAEGFFWKPCVLCGRPYGGHEIDWESPLSIFVESQDYPGYSEVICPVCAAAGKGDPKLLDGFEEPVVQCDPTTTEEEGKA